MRSKLVRSIPARIAIMIAVTLIVSAAFAESHDNRPDSADPYRAWYFVWGGSNVYPGLEISEDFIARRIDLPLRLLFWDWHKPTTFRDWRDSGFLWEPYFGVLKGIDRHWAVFFTGGAIGGDMTNTTSNHLLVLPLRTKIKFFRFAAYATVGVDYYPFERPKIDALPRTFSVKQSLSLAKPFVAVGLTAMKQIEVGSVELALPGVGRIFRQKEKFDYTFGHFSTRIGIELPIDKNDSVTMAAGYAFCAPHSEEFSGPVLSIFHVHRF